MTWNFLTNDQKIKTKILDIDKNITDGTINEILETGDKQKHRTNIRGSMTDFRTTTPYLSVLKKIISENIEYEKFIIRNFWGHYLTGNDHISPHNHLWDGSTKEKIPRAKAFVFYIDVPVGSGEIYFNDYGIEILPKNNQLMLFDCDVMHEVLPNYDAKIKRISCAGNLTVL